MFSTCQTWDKYITRHNNKKRAIIIDHITIMVVVAVFVLVVLFLIWLIRQFYSLYETARDKCTKMHDRFWRRPKAFPDPRSQARIQTSDILYECAHNQNLLCTTYFCQSKETQHKHLLAPRDSYAYMAKWYESVYRLVHDDTADSIQHDFYVIVFYTGLSPSFVKKYETNRIRFMPCTMYAYSPQDESFLVYRELFHHCRPLAVAASNISNVIVQTDPFTSTLQRYPSESTFFTARDSCALVHDTPAIGVRSWKEVERAHKQFWFRLPQKLLYHGVCSPQCFAGYTDPFARVMETVCEFLAQLRPTYRYEVLAFNYALFQLRQDKTLEFHYVDGSPFTTHHKDGTTRARTNAPFRLLQ